jgi:hypothetical protein
VANVTLETKVTEPAPLDYTIPGAQQIEIIAARASFDGTGAAGSFVPTLRIIAPDGQEVAACPVSTLAAGVSADVSWFPRVAVQASSPGGFTIVTGTVQPYGVVVPTSVPELYVDLSAYPNSTGLYINLRGDEWSWMAIAAGALTGLYPGIGISTPGASDPAESGFVVITAPGSQDGASQDGAVFINGMLAANNSGNQLSWNPDQAPDGEQILTVQTGSTGQYLGTLQDKNGAMSVPSGLGVFGHAPPAAQPATPITLAQVIAVLQGAGLCV